MKPLFLALVCSIALSAQQTVTIPAQTITLPVSSATQTANSLISPADLKTLYGSQQKTGTFPWLQISGIPAPSSASFLLNSDLLLIRGSLQSGQKNQPNGVAGLDAFGRVLPANLPAYATKLSQLQNDPGFYNAQTLPPYPATPTKLSQLANDPGFLTLATLPPYPTKLSQLINDIAIASNGPAVAVPSALSQLTNDIQAYTPATLPPYPVIPTVVSTFQNDAGYLTASSLALLIPTLLPAPPAIPTDLSAFTNGPGYATLQQVLAALPIPQPQVTSINGQTGAITIPLGASGAPDFQINARNFGCKADGSDDSACLNKALAAAGTQNPSGTNFYGSEVLIPCGIYGVGNPLIIPRAGGAGNFAYGPGNGTVSIRGQHKGCVVLVALPSFPRGITGIAITNIGSGYTSVPTITLSGGGASVQGTAVATIFGGSLNSIFLSTPGTGYTGMPTCTVSGGGGSGATCMAVGHAMIETGRTVGRMVGVSIENISFVEPPVQGTMAFHHWMVNPEIGTSGTSGGGPVTERMEGASFRNLQFYGDNGNTPADIYIAGDCEGCVIDGIFSNSSRGSAANYETVAVMTDPCVNGSMSNEGCGLQIGGSISHIQAGGTRGGFVAAFQGRIMREEFHSGFSNGLRGGLPNSVCYLFENSVDNVITNIANEGNGESAQIELVNSRLNEVVQWGIGVPNNQGNGVGNGLVLINSSSNIFRTNEAESVWSQSSFANLGLHAIVLDSNSHGNQILNAQLTGASDYSIADLATNYLQFCDASSSGCRLGQMFSVGALAGR